ncbi:hypothetical protein D6C89_07767 [Aureobasidium pullulans]|nr:hypothetical protein D6C89_07767 [Aureobasidium pullulans]
MMAMANPASFDAMVQASAEGVIQLITTAFLDSIVFFTTLGLCILAPKISLKIFQSTTRWKFSPEHQEVFRVGSMIVLTLMHAFLSMLFALHDDSGLTPNAPSVFWAVMWSSGILLGVAGGFTAAAVVLVLGSDIFDL